MRDFLEPLASDSRKGDARGEHRDRLGRLHFVDSHRRGTRQGNDGALSRRNQARRLLAAPEERVQVRVVPDIVDDQETMLELQSFGERVGRGFLVRKAERLTGELPDQQRKLFIDARPFAQSHPQDTAGERHDDAIVVAQRLGQCRLSKGSCTAERGRDGDRRLAMVAENERAQRVELRGPVREVGGKVVDHEWHAVDRAARFDLADERVLLRGIVEIDDVPISSQPGN